MIIIRLIINMYVANMGSVRIGGIHLQTSRGRKWIRVKYVWGLISIVLVGLYQLVPSGSVVPKPKPELAQYDFSTMWLPLRLQGSSGRTFSMDIPVDTFWESHHGAQMGVDYTLSPNSPFESLQFQEEEEGDLQMRFYHGVLKKSLQGNLIDWQMLNRSYYGRQVKGLQEQESREVSGGILHVYAATIGNEENKLIGLQDGRDVWYMYLTYGTNNMLSDMLVDTAINSVTVN